MKTALMLASIVAIAFFLPFLRAAWRLFTVKPSRSSGLFSTDHDYLTVRSADNVRLLSDEQLRALEQAVDERGDT